MGEEGRPPTLPPAPRRWLMGAVAVLIVYGNLCVALQPPQLGITPLPRPAWLFDMFLLPGMFNSYTTTNYDFRIMGLRDLRGRQRDRGQWVVLPLSDHFPQRTGLTFTQLYAPHHREVLGTRGQRQAWATMARKIRKRHNFLHPDWPVTRVKLGTLEWPVHPAGYRAGKKSESTRLRIWFSEEAQR